MLHIKNLDEGLEIFKTLGSDVRMRIVELLSEHGAMNMNELAVALELTNGALTSHIRKLEECGIIQTVTEGTGHGNQKLCSMKIDQILLDAGRAEEQRETGVLETEVRIGEFSDCRVSAPCGLCSAYNLIGEENNPQYFSHVNHLEVGMLWFAEGYVEYRVPCMITENQQIRQLTFYFESSSDQAENSEMSRTKVDFYLNEEKVGTWTTRKEFQWEKGIYTPLWWTRKDKQSGRIKMIVIDRFGSYFEGIKVSNVTLNELQLERQKELCFRFVVNDKSRYHGGLVLYGSSFGNYNQDIKVRVHYVSDH